MPITRSARYSAQTAQDIGAKLLETAMDLNQFSAGLEDHLDRRSLRVHIKTMITLSNQLAKLASDLSAAKA